MRSAIARSGSRIQEALQTVVNKCKSKDVLYGRRIYFKAVHVRHVLCLRGSTRIDDNQTKPDIRKDLARYRWIGIEFIKVEGRLSLSLCLVEPVSRRC